MSLPFHEPMLVGESPIAVEHLRPVNAWPPLPDQSDALADPADEVVAQGLYGLLPAGPAWRTPDNTAFDENSRLGGFLRGLAGDMADLYRRLFGTGMESTASTLDQSLDDWEIEFGLPDPCLGPEPSRDMRLRFLLAKVRSTGTITPGDFIWLAAGLGYEVEIEEPVPFECGQSEIGAWHEVAGGGYELGEPTLIMQGAEHAVEFDWIVRIKNVAVIYFECGLSQCGADALTEFGRAEDLECLFRSLAPAWTRPIFSYG